MTLVPDTLCAFILVEKIKTGISSIFNYAVLQFNEAWNIKDIKTWIRYHYQNSACITIA